MKEINCFGETEDEGLARQAFQDGLRLRQEGRPDIEILAAFRRAYNNDDQNPCYLSYYGLYRALAENDFVGGVSLAKQALQMDYLRPEYYLNLGKIFLKMHCRGQAVAFFL